MILLVMLFASCAEYRFELPNGKDKYCGWAKTQPRLDPKLGSKAKLYYTDHGKSRPYIGGDFQRKYLRMNVGVLQYLDDRSSIEIGYRSTILEFDKFDRSESFGIDLFDEASHLFYIGGVVRW